MTLDEWDRRAQWPLTGLALVFLLAYTWDVVGDLRGTSQVVCNVAMELIWITFIVDYIVRVSLAPDRRDWVLHHILDLVVVALPMFRPLRLITMLHVLHRTGGVALRGRIDLYAGFSATLLVFVGALAALDAERHAPGATITTFGRALWWASVTITTVGYGDVVPVTLTGRVVAVVLMLGGIAVLGVVTGTVASSIVERVAAEDEEQQAATRAQVRRLSEQVRELSNEVHDRWEDDDEQGPQREGVPRSR